MTKNRTAGAKPATSKAGTAAASAAPAERAPATVLTSTSAFAGAAGGRSQDAGESSPQILYGSSTLASLIEIGDQEVQLGTVVAAAHAASGLTVAAWNELSEEDRDVLLNAQVDAMRERAADQARERERQEQAEQEAAQQAEAEAQERARAQREQARKAQEKAATEAQAKAFPCVITVSNNSGIPLVEPYTGAFITAGGTAQITLHSPEHAHNVGQNLKAALDANYIPYDKLVIEGLPK